jgi:hypothetical protein
LGVEFPPYQDSRGPGGASLSDEHWNESAQKLSSLDLRIISRALVAL